MVLHIYYGILRFPPHHTTDAHHADFYNVQQHQAFRSLNLGIRAQISVIDYKDTNANTILKGASFDAWGRWSHLSAVVFLCCCSGPDLSAQGVSVHCYHKLEWYNLLHGSNTSTADHLSDLAGFSFYHSNQFVHINFRTIL